MFINRINKMILCIKLNHKRYTIYDHENNKVEVESAPRGGSRAGGIVGFILTNTSHGSSEFN